MAKRRRSKSSKCSGSIQNTNQREKSKHNGAKYKLVKGSRTVSYHRLKSAAKDAQC